MIRKHALYFEAEGGIGSWDAQVYVATSPRRPWANSDSELLCTLGGVRQNWQMADRGYAWLRVDFATEATDVEHDRAHLADLWLAAPLLLARYDDAETVAGFGFDLHLPTQEWLDAQMASTEMCPDCTGQNEERQPHQIVEYLPPERHDVAALRHPLLVIEFTRVRV